MKAENKIVRLLPDTLFTQIQFLHHQHKILRLKNPKTFNEKIQWFKLYYRNELLKTCADKYTVRDFVAKTIGEWYLVPLLEVYVSPRDIRFDSLPDRFVIKLSHGSGWNILCRSKTEFNADNAIKKIKEWCKKDFFPVGREWAYKGLTPRILFEEYLAGANGEPPFDYKFFCFNGHPEYVQVDFNRFVNHTRALYDVAWHKLPCSLEYPFNREDNKKPLCFNEMLEVAAVLSKPFPFVRVDLYELGKKVYFGELTFYPGKGVEKFIPPEWDRKFGEKMQIDALISERCLKGHGY